MKPILNFLRHHLSPFGQSFLGFFEDEGLVMAGHLAFITLLSLLPFLIFLVSLSGFVGQTDTGVYAVAYLLSVMPESVKNVLEGPINEVVGNTRPDILTFSMLFSVWTASSGLEALRVVLNRALGVRESRRIWKRRIASASFVFMFSGFIILGVAALIFGPVIWLGLRDWLELPEFYGWVWTAGRYAITATAFITVLVLLYQLLPARRLSLRHTIPGAVVALGLWLLAGSLFSQYLKYMGNFAVTYGSLGGIMLALMFFYIMGADRKSVV